MNLSNFSTSQQERIYHRLNFLVSPGAAAFWHNACCLMEMKPPLECTTHFVGHSLREIEGSLRAVLEPFWKPDRTDDSGNPNHKAQIRAILQALEILETSDIEDLLAVLEPFWKPDKTDDSGNPNHKAQIRAILQALEIPETSDVAKTWLNRGLHKYAHRNNLSSPRPVDDKFRQFWIKIQAVLDEVLDKFEAHYSNIHNLLDELLIKSEPSGEDIEKLRHIPNSRVGLGYFFEKLEFPGWLEPLWRKGFFKHPPEPAIDPESESNGIYFLPWPQSRYLTRMASKEPETVLNIIQEILNLGTQNTLVHENFADAAIKMPPSLAAKWAKEEIKWLTKQKYFYFNLPDKISKLIFYLAQNKQVDVALELTRELLTPTLDRENNNFSQIRCDDYYYIKILQKDILELVSVTGYQIVNLLCDLLSSSIHRSQLSQENAIYEDYSYRWCPTLEEDRPNYLYDIQKGLAIAVYKTTEKIVKENPSNLNSLIQTIESYHYPIFYRIVLQLLRCFPQENKNLVAERLANKNCLNEYKPYPEYKLLLQENFANLDSELQKTILSWIVAGPEDISWIKKEKITLYIKKWQYDWLAILNHNLPQEQRRKYDQLILEINPTAPLKFSELPEICQESQSLKRSISTEALSEMSMPELFDFLENWQPTGEIFAASRGSVAIKLSDIIAQKTEDFIKEIDRFKKLPLDYGARGFIKGLQKHIDENSEAQIYSWERILEFCNWLLERNKNTLKHRNSVNHSDHSIWNQTCEVIVDLIDAGLKLTGKNQISLQFRLVIWKILEQLAEDSSLTPGFDRDYRYLSSDGYYISSINTVRGKAIHTIMQYALWIRNYWQKENNKKANNASFFNEIPEVKIFLERHLNLNHNPSLIIRSIYGYWLPTLMDIDLDWTTQNLETIFPRDQEFQKFRAAAWEGYITTANANSYVFDILQGEYRYAIEQLSISNSEEQNQEVNRCLVKHLCVLYWHGVIDFSKPKGLLEDFFSKALANNREEFMRKVGEKLHSSNVEVDADLLERLKKLWEWRINSIEKAGVTHLQASDLKLFSWWFTSRKFDDNWAITQLNKTLKLAKALHIDLDLLQNLVALAPSLPLATVKCLGLMADAAYANEAQHYNWFFHHQEDCRNIVSVALQSENKEAQKAAQELINRLLARNYADLRDLLPSQ
jgi:hypothetical protein